MNSTPWVLLDTETNGITAPVFVVEIGARRMRGWSPEGPPFRRLLNQNADIPPEASRVHGYTREILERDGEDARTVYRDFATYVVGMPLVAFNLAYDLDDVLIPEWQRLGIQHIGQRGFCALRLAQRLLDPVPAGNCKLQTLRQFYRLPERGAHTAMGDVETVADLIDQVLQPLAGQRGLSTWEAIVEYTEAPWFPSRIAFGKHKGRDFREARMDEGLRGWLEWLAGSSSERSATMGRWYLSRLEMPAESHWTMASPAFDESAAAQAHAPGAGIVVFVDPEVEDLKCMISAARIRLADLEAEYTRERHGVDVTQSRLFGLLREEYQRRDRLKLVVDYRQKYLEALLQTGEDEAEEVTNQYEEARQQSDAEYEQVASAAADQQELTPEESAELQTLWRKLVRLFHPDRFANDPEKRAAFEWLTGEINRARDRGDVRRLREIANDPNGYMLQQGLEGLDFADAAEVVHLRRLLDTLQQRIIAALEALNELREDSRYELHTRVAQHPGSLDEVAAEQAQSIEDEIADLIAKAAALAEEIEMLTGAAPLGVAR